jgi:uncharacterized membrane protein
MDILFWLTLIASLIILIMLVISLCTDDIEAVKVSIIITAFITFFCIIGLLVEEPTAMDVYKNKTTLKYTVVDGIKQDSVVIFKK